MSDTLFFFQKGMILVVMLSLPAIAVAVLSGVLISIVQTVLSVQDQALPFAVKLLAVGVVLVASGRWMGVEVISLADAAFQMLAKSNIQGLQ